MDSSGARWCQLLISWSYFEGLNSNISSCSKKTNNVFGFVSTVTTELQLEVLTEEEPSVYLKHLSLKKKGFESNWSVKGIFCLWFALVHACEGPASSWCVVVTLGCSCSSGAGSIWQLWGPRCHHRGIGWGEGCNMNSSFSVGRKETF